MLTASKLVPAGKGLASALLKRAATVELDWDVRQKSRFDATDSSGRQLGVFLPRGTAVRGGDVLVAEDGSLIRVLAAPQPVMVIRHCPQHGTPFDLLRAAYHLGNRHVAIELQSDHLKIEPDHVLAEMLDRMHLIVTEERLAFEPEGGAYQAGGHSHGDSHGRGHGHDQGRSQGHGHGHGHAHDHDHGQGHHEGHGHVHEDGQGHRQGHSHGHGHDHDQGHAPAPAAAPAEPDERAHGHRHGHAGHGHSH